jgi:hypothetical protein
MARMFVDANNKQAYMHTSSSSTIHHQLTLVLFHNKEYHSVFVADFGE